MCVCVCVWNTPKGGVAVLVREGLRVELAKPPKKRELNPLVWDLWHSTSWIHVRLAMRDGRTVLHVVSVYGVQGDRESNAALWDDVLQKLCLCNAPHAVGAHCNCVLRCPRDMSEEALANLLTRRLVDGDLEFV